MAWTTPKTWSAGETLTAANFNTYIRDNDNATMHILASKSADETVNNSTTLQNDDHLFFTVGANDVFALNIMLVCTDSTGTTADIKIAFTLPAGGVMRLSSVTFNAAATLTVIRWDSSGVAADLATSNLVSNVHFITGTYAGSGTGGTFQMQWAQNVLTVTDTKILKGSYIAGAKLA